jgi:wyosine [tRNA(Phe)-imidazoG37] synthetase (radical SAM superfamily)
MDRRPCMALWKTPQMAWNGELGVCCMDPGLALSLGNFKDKTFEELWMGDKVHQWRLHHIRGEFEKVFGERADKTIFSCEGCPGIRFPPVTDEEIIKYLEITEEHDDILPYLERVNSPSVSKFKPMGNFLQSTWLKENWWLTLELNATCNLKCPMCSQYVSEIDGKPMPLETIKTQVKHFIKNNIKFHSLTPFYRGESLLHPQIKEIIDYLAEQSIHKLWKLITLHTNANLLTKEVSLKLIKLFNSLEAGELFFSLDAASQSTYDKVRKGGNLIKAQNNIIEFIKQKQENPFMIFQFIVMDENIDEVVPFTKFWSHILKQYNQDFVIAKTYDRLLDVNKYKTNIIYFRRKEGTPQEQDHSFKLQEQAYRELEEAGFELK